MHALDGFIKHLKSLKQGTKKLPVKYDLTKTRRKLSADIFAFLQGAADESFG